MKLLILLAIISGYFVVPSTSQATCTVCDWGMIGLSDGSTVLKRFADDEASANTAWDNMISFGLTAVTADEACNAHNACGDNSTCTSRTTNYFLCECDLSFSPKRTSNEFNCADTDECDLATHNCSSNATCNNKSPGFDCTCNTGYTGNGTYCEDTDECDLATHNCSNNATCYNTSLGFDCTCNTGYTANGTSCEDIDECASDPCGTNANCTNSKGSFTCTCNTGYSGDGFTCEHTPTQDIAPPIMGAVLAFVIIVLLALLVCVLVRKRRSSTDKHDLSHVYMDVIGVQPPVH